MQPRWNKRQAGPVSAGFGFIQSAQYHNLIVRGADRRRKLPLNQSGRSINAIRGGNKAGYSLLNHQIHTSFRDSGLEVENDTRWGHLDVLNGCAALVVRGGSV